MDGYDFGGPAAMIGDFGGVPSKASDWKCMRINRNSDVPAGWNTNTFDDSSWLPAVSYSRNRDRNMWYRVGRWRPRPRISLSAEWIWTIDYDNSNRVLCRYKPPGPPPQVQNDFSFTVVPGPFNASRCSFSNLPSSTVAGTSTVISIVSRDYNGNPRSGSKIFFQVTVVGPDSVRTTFSTADPNQAQYTSTFTPSVAGTYSVSIRIRGVDIEGSPAKLTVNPAVANAAKSSVYGYGLVTAIAGSTAVFKISLRDKFGNMYRWRRSQQPRYCV